MVDDGNGRVTLAVVQNDVRHLTEAVRSWREEATKERRVLAECIKDHEKRLVNLERFPWLVRGLAALISPIAIWATIEVVKTLVAVL